MTQMQPIPDEDTWRRMLRLSEELDDAICRIVGSDGYRTFDVSSRITASFQACSVSLEHARGLRTLMAEDMPTSAIALMRLQFEALTRSVWLLYAAPDAAVEKLTAPLSPSNEKAANKLPMLAEMLAAIDGKAPPPALQMLNQFKEITAAALNSFVHGGIHAIKRHSEGYPVPLLIQVLRNSNGLLTITGMMFATLAGDQELMRKMSQIQAPFRECLPELLAH